MISLLTIKKFLGWANLGLYRKNNPLNRLELQNDSPHYKINDLSEPELNEEIFNFNKTQGGSDAEQIEREG
tara:strand:- start:20 stop:232 length:213 start_codon:yes stop_codon:yes gene_type:complete